MNVRSALAPISTDPKSWLAGVTEITGVAVPTPITGRVAPPPPVKLTFWLNVPSEVGLKRTVTTCD